MTPESTTLSPTAQAAEIEALAKRIREDKERLTTLRRSQPHQPVSDYTFTAPDGSAHTLSSLFGDKNELVLIHNMGVSCTYCTMWADGLNGVLHHLTDRAAFVVVSPDAPAVQKNVLEKRQWRFRLLSHQGSTFSSDMGFHTTGGGYDGEQPGVSTFAKGTDGQIARVSRDSFGPGDEYCAVWHLFDLLPDSDPAWAPKFAY